MLILLVLDRECEFDYNCLDKIFIVFRVLNF